MGWFSSTWFGGAGAGGALPTFPVLANAATASTIQERIITLITAITPAALSANKFRHTQGEGDFRAECEAAPAGAFRRFDVADTGEREMFDASSVDVTLQTVTFAITVAYDRSKRAGVNGVRDRVALMDEDWRKINFAIGAYGRGNFSLTNDCTPLGATRGDDEEDVANGLDYLVITARFSHYLDNDA